MGRACSSSPGQEGKRERGRGGDVLTGTRRHTAIGTSSQFAGSSALPPFSSKSSEEERSQSVKQNNYIPSKVSESGTCSTRISSPPFLIITEDLGGFPIQRQSVSVESEGCRTAWLTFRRIIVPFTHGVSPSLPCTRLGSYRSFLFKNRCISGAVCCGDVIDSGQQCP